jgi:hypothetical protein
MDALDSPLMSLQEEELSFLQHKTSLWWSSSQCRCREGWRRRYPLLPMMCWNVMSNVNCVCVCVCVCEHHLRSAFSKLCSEWNVCGSFCFYHTLFMENHNHCVTFLSIENNF